MNAKSSLLLFAALCLSGILSAQEAEHDTTFAERNIPLDEVVVTGTRNETDVRHLSQTVSVIPRLTIEKSLQSSLLPVLWDTVCPTVRRVVSLCVDFQAVTHV